MIAISIALCTIFSHAQEWNPAFYCIEPEGLTPQTKNALHEIKKLSLNGTESVLDIGCGSGDITKLIGTYIPGGAIHGIDISESMIHNALQENLSENVTFKCISLFDYNPEKKFDVVVCFWVLYLFENYEEALAKVLSFLKPGGKALICHIIDPGTPFDQLLQEIIQPRLPKLLFPRITTIMNAIRNSCAKIQNIEIKYAHDHYASFADFISSMKTIPFYQDVLTADEEIAFFNKLPSVYQLAADGSLSDSSLIVSMVLEK
jgi:trans-aconitate methyltransferase